MRVRSVAESPLPRGILPEEMSERMLELLALTLAAVENWLLWQLAQYELKNPEP
jgi:hypothetical protein